MHTARLDRLSALVKRFTLDVTADNAANANLGIFSYPDSHKLAFIVFSPGSRLSDHEASSESVTALFLARAEWGGSSNPLISALPERIEYSISNGDDIDGLADLLVNECRDQRCGSGSIINRLGEVLVIRLLREQINAGTSDVGLLGGLADPKLCRAIVAMHERPGKPWSIDQLAAEAGLSGSRFCDRFQSTVGQTPMSYLRSWRMTLALQDVKRGNRIQTIAARYGYASNEALTRAFKRHFGEKPTAYRVNSQAR